jgi:hypothetical protein
MRFRKVYLGALVVAIAGLAFAAQPGSPGDLVVHEWGTFLAMNGSDGIALEGMYHEEHALPAFVHARGRDQLRLPSVVLKGETPVIYFYTGHAQKVRVDVRFPRGLWTQWYPQAQVVGPQLTQATTPPELRDGRIRWCAELIPAAAGGARIAPAPPAASKDALWNFARDVDAAFVRTSDRTKDPAPFETERFLFYRGLGRANLPVRLTASDGGTLSSDSSEPHGVRDVFILRVEGGRGSYVYLPALRPGDQRTGVIPSMGDSLPMAEFSRRIADQLASRLVANGLYAKEARAMVNTWRASYFESEGVRALFVLPRQWTDASIPMTITPAPRDLVRVMVGRLELLSPGREQIAEQAVNDLAAGDAGAREHAYNVLREQGRYVEPIVRRVLSSTKDERVRTLCRRLLLTDFVTDLRTAVSRASDGSRVVEDPVYVRAQLASVLREIGLDAEASAEGNSVLKVLKSRPEPPMERAEARGHLRAFARAMEATGDDRGAAESYKRFIMFGSQVGTKKDCIGCHGDAGPRDLAWFRDWWAGRRYALATLRAGLADEAVAGHEKAIAAGKSDAATRLMLTYLYEASGSQTKARAVWTALLGSEQAATVLAGARLPSDDDGKP